MEKRLLMFLAGLFLSVGAAVAQMQVTGTVVSSEDGEPIVGASVMVAGTKTGTSTDVDGKFGLSVQAGSKLVVTYLGMRPKTVTALGNMKIKLDPDNRVLDEVVVTAMGITREKKALGYASQVLDAKDLNTSEHRHWPVPCRES